MLSREALTKQAFPQNCWGEERASCTNRPGQAREMERWGEVFFWEGSSHKVGSEGLREGVT